MKIATYISCVLSMTLATAVSAYELSIIFQDGIEVRVTGDHSSPCQNMPLEVRDNKVVAVTFDKGKLTNSFDIYSELFCAGTIVKRGGEGRHDVQPSAKVGSFRVS